MHLKLNTMGLPVIERIGRYPLVNPVFDFTYRNPTHTVHLYNYSGRVRVGGKVYKFEPGDLTCIRSGSVYSFESDEPRDHWCVHFFSGERSDTRQIELPPILQIGVNSLFLREQLKHISSLFNACGKEEHVELMKVEARYRLKAFLLSVYLQSCGRTERTRREQVFNMESLLAWLEEHLPEALSVEQVARQAGVSRATLAKHFREKQGMTLSQYLLHKRIDRAKSLLITTSLTVCEVGASVGIADPQYFNKQFRKVDGQSPTHYRESHRMFVDNMSSGEAIQGGEWRGR